MLDTNNLRDATVGLKKKVKKVKKGKKTSKNDNVDKKGRKNHKAFGVAHNVSAKKSMQRNLDKKQQKEVVPLIDRSKLLLYFILFYILIYFYFSYFSRRDCSSSNSCRHYGS